MFLKEEMLLIGLEKMSPDILGVPPSLSLPTIQLVGLLAVCLDLDAWGVQRIAFQNQARAPFPGEGMSS